MQWLQKTAIVAAGAGILALATGCAVDKFGIKIGGAPQVKKGPPPHAPAHGYRAKYRYRYYPEAQVYFDASRGLYFYRQDGKWTVAASLPATLEVKLGEHVTLELETDKPYTEFDVHRKKYPPGKKGRKKEKKK